MKKKSDPICGIRRGKGSISSTFRFLYEIFGPKITKPNVTREKLLNSLSYKKRARKMLMKLTQGAIKIIPDIFCHFSESPPPAPLPPV